jgi:putative two-component system response regulator
MEGSMIPLAARIVTLADVYDALRMKRSYKPAYSHEIAMQKIRQEQKVHFDPDILEVALRIHDKFAEVYAKNAD